jgi:acyl carrier protein
MDINSTIRKIIIDECYNLKPEIITDDASFDDLGVESLALIDIWMHIGQEFGLYIPDPDNAFWKEHPVTCLKDLVSTLERLRELGVVTGRSFPPPSKQFLSD